MNKLNRAIFQVIKLIILIGDFTLYVFKTAVSALKSLIRLIILFLTTLINLLFFAIFRSSEGVTFIFSKIPEISQKISIPKLSIPFKFAYSPPKRLRKLKKKKVKKITIFPFSSIWIKARYFAFGFFFSAVFVFLPILAYIYFQDLPNPKTLAYQESPQTTKIFDRNGKLLYQIYANQNRTKIALKDMPLHLQRATIAIEDKDFYSNPGFDIQAIIRSAIADLSGKPIQGGSTITQQLIKSELLSPERTITRKVKELFLAFWAEKLYSKDQILEMYLNEIPYGGTAWGAEAAAQTYFGKKAKDLTLSESAFLAGLPNAPSIYSPYGQNPNLWKTRHREVLKKMNEQRYISKAEMEGALKENLTFKKAQEPIHAPHFVMYVKEVLAQKYGLSFVEKGGLSVRTSLDLDLQEKTEKIVREHVELSSYLNLTNGGSVVTNPKNGDILAMVGSKDYSDSNGGNYNVTTAIRQPGSSIKVVTYANALSKGFTAATTIQDNPISFRENGSPAYTPVNYDGRFRGSLTLRQALGNSINIPAVKLLKATGIPSMIELGKEMGITTWNEPEKYGLAITLGSADVRMIDMATVYGTLANQGKRVDLNPVLEVIDSKGNSLEKKEIRNKRVMDAGVAFIISDILSDNSARAMEFGTSSPLVIPGYTVAVKTGTTDNKRDNWTIGYTPSYVVSVWVGNNDNSPMDPRLTSGITGAAPIWHSIMSLILSGKNDEKYPAPGNIVQKSCFGRNEYFVKGTENFASCNFRRIFPSSTP
jgi:1A family penicillin-binding protein